MIERWSWTMGRDPGAGGPLEALVMINLENKTAIQKKVRLYY